MIEKLSFEHYYIVYSEEGDLAKAINYNPYGKNTFSREDLKAIFETGLLHPQHGKMLRDSFIDKKAYVKINSGKIFFRLIIFLVIFVKEFKKSSKNLVSR